VSTRLRLYNHQRTQPANLKLWRAVAKRALPLCLAAAKSPDTDLHRLEEIEFSFVSDEDIGRVHGEFLDDPTPTDIITFSHGEILISLDTALRQGTEHGQSLDQEASLYIIHGLLHLAGWDDHVPEEAAAMKETQERILAEVWEW
jgi:probable rRNA maturation factor